MPVFSKEAAIADFKKKYREKTGNAWEHRKAFQHMPGKYEPVEMDYSAPVDDEPKPAAAAAAAARPRPGTYLLQNVSTCLKFGNLMMP
jgi:poly [ADP-ribose] polymerase